MNVGMGGPDLRLFLSAWTGAAKSGLSGREALGHNSVWASLGGFSGAAMGRGQPDWNKIPTQGGTDRSEAELEKAVIALARKEAEGGILAGTKERAALAREFMSLASPDRKAAYAKYDGVGGAVLGGVANAFGGKELMLYSAADGSWSTMPTQNELDMLSRFHEIYRNAYTVYESEYGEVAGTPKVGPAGLDVTA